MEWYFLNIAITVGVFLVLILAAALWEKRPVKCYGPAQSNIPGDFVSYLSRVDAEAGTLGLVDRSVHKHVKYDIFVLVWFSPQRDIIIESGQGRIAKMPTAQTWLYSRLDNGRFLITSDRFGDEDLSGLSKTRYVWKGSLSQLLKKHRAMLEASELAVQPFTEETAADALEAMRREQTDRSVQLGRVRWLDDEHSQWRYTLTGGLRTAANLFKQLGVALSQIWRFWK
ncbi:MAG: hypothetical protein KAT11_06340 [Phycisphaerae bacterium]|nr:hypothetical protein [Phycisphaerae bacterium]